MTGEWMIYPLHPSSLFAGWEEVCCMCSRFGIEVYLRRFNDTTKTETTLTIGLFGVN